MTIRILRWFRISCWLAFICWTGAVYFLSSLSGPEVAAVMPIRIWDKFLHFLAFATGAVPLFLALRLSTPWPWKRIAVVAIALVSAYGASDEWHQQFTPYRSAKDLGDWTADTLGAAAGTLVTALIYARYSQSPRLAPARA